MTRLTPRAGAVALATCVALLAPAGMVGATELRPLARPGSLAGELAALGGKVVVLNFWATWCEPCRRELPLLQRLQEEHDDDRLRVVLASVDARDRAGVVRRALRELDVALTTWHPAGPVDMEAFGVGPALPATVVLGVDGRVVERIQGVFDEAQLRQRVNVLLGGEDAGAGQVGLADDTVGHAGHGDQGDDAQHEHVPPRERRGALAVPS